MFVDLLKTGLDAVGVGTGVANIGISVSLLASALYWRKMLAFAGKGRKVASMMVFAAVAIGVLAILGVVELNPSTAKTLGSRLFNWVTGMM